MATNTAFIQLDPVNELEEVTGLQEGHMLFVPNNGTQMFRISVDTFNNLSKTAKPLKPTDATPTEEGLYMPTEIGTYSNAGGLTADEGFDTLFFFDGTTWTKRALPYPQASLNLRIYEDLTSGTILNEKEQVISNNINYIVKDGDTAEVGVDIPGESDKWIPISPILQYTTGKNLFNKKNILAGKEVHGSGAVLNEPNSVTSELIPINATQKSLIVWGLQANTGQYRYYRFLDENENLILVEPFDAYYIIVEIPVNARFFQFSPKQRNSNPTNIENVQVEYGVINTDYEDYKEYISLINKNYLTTKKNYEGLSYIFLGDSKVQTGNPDVGNFGWGVRENFPIYLLPKLKASNFRNYARSGASFKEYLGQLEWQKISRQVTQAIDDKATLGEPNIIIIGCGTNDGITELGNYTTAMSKTINNLDMSLTAEAMRSAFYRLQEAFPNSVIIYGTPTQRADVEPETWQSLYDLVVKMAGRYGAHIANVRDNSGIVKDFEIWDAVGRDLVDGLHPKISGQIKESYVYERLIKYLFQ